MGWKLGLVFWLAILLWSTAKAKVRLRDPGNDHGGELPSERDLMKAKIEGMKEDLRRDKEEHPNRPLPSPLYADGELCDIGGSGSREELKKSLGQLPPAEQAKLDKLKTDNKTAYDLEMAGLEAVLNNATKSMELEAKHRQSVNPTNAEITEINELYTKYYGNRCKSGTCIEHPKTGLATCTAPVLRPILIFTILRILGIHFF